MAGDTNLMEKLSALCKRRGFIYPGSEIYGGIGGFWDYGPLGVELKRNIKDAWWRDMITNPPDGPDGKQVSMVGVDCALIMNPRVWEASGHVGGFSDPMVDCKECKARFRADYLISGRLIAIPQIPDNGQWWIGDLVPLARSQPNAPLLWGVRGEPGESLQKVARKALGDDRAKVVVRETETPNVGPPATGVFVESKGRSYFWAVDETPKKLEPGDMCPACGGELTEPREFNLMFETYVGALRDASAKAYLRPETAQGIFVNWSNVVDTMRVKLPFGIAQVGKSFRNEINPRNYTFRSREFEQMEIEFFCPDETAMDWYEFWRNTRYNWYVNLGLQSEKLRLRDQLEDELAHYSKACADIEYLFPFADEHQELEGVAHRGCYDLEQHQKHSGRDLTYFDDDLWQQDAAKYKDDKDAAKKAKQGAPYRFLPTVIEPSAGADRAALAFLCEAYTEDEAPNDKGKMETRVVMKFHPRLAPVKAAFFPLVNKEGMPEIAEKLYREAKKRYNVFYDVKGAIGRRYRRQDEAGTPFCITVDGDTVSNGTVTIRDRDTLKQERVSQDQLMAWLGDRLA